MELQKKHRDNEIKIRLTDDERIKIKKKAFEAGLQEAVFIRECSLSKEVRAAMTISQMAEIRKINMVLNLLNRVCKEMHIYGLERSSNEVEKILNHIKQLITWE